MKITLFKATIIIVALALFSCSKDEDGIYFSNASELIFVEKVNYSALESDVLNLVNAHRQSMGLTSLITLNNISGVAVVHTNYMINKNDVNHDYFNQREQYLVTYANAKSVAENVAYGYATAQGVLNGWLNSKAHREAIESEKFTHFGISIASNSDNRNYFTQIFISK